MKRRTFIKRGLLASGSVLVLGDLEGTRVLAQDASGTPKQGGTLTWGHSETTQNLDIHQTGTASTLRLLQNVHEPLLTIDDHFHVQPNLAASWERSQDWLTYTFHLRNDVVFHNGKKLTAADVKYSFERIKDPKTSAVSFDVFEDVAAIDAVDDHTVRVTMSKVYSPFEARITYLNCAIIPQGSGDTQGKQPIGAGAFEFVQREFGNFTRLKRFDNYFRGPAYLDEIVEREVTEATVRLTGVQTGQMTLINDIPLDRIAQVEKSPNLQVKTWHPLSWAFLNFNHKVPPFDDPDVRKAFDLMIDKQALVQGALWGQGVPTPTPSFPNSPYRNNDLEVRKQDLNQAKALLQKAGVRPASLSIKFKVTTNYPWHVQAAQIMQAWFQQAGVNVSLEQLTWSDWLSQVWKDKNFSLTMVNFFTLWEPDFLYYNIWHTGGSFNFRNISDATLDGYLDQARQSTSEDQRVTLYREAQQRIFDQAHDVILWYRNGSLAAVPALRGIDTIVQPNGSNLAFWRTWLAT